MWLKQGEHKEAAIGGGDQVVYIRAAPWKGFGP